MPRANPVHTYRCMMMCLPMMWHHVQDIVVDSDVDDATRMACTEALTFLSVCPEGQQSILEHHVIAALTSACRVSGPKSRTLYVSVFVSLGGAHGRNCC